jgi:hypothetical protein
MPKRSRDQTEAAGRPPVARRRLNFGALNDKEFELLCSYVVAIEFPDAEHVANPDGGADSALPRTDRSWRRCWQAKHFTAQISWSQCKESLDAAVANYGMPHYTFCFSRDLTLNQINLFKQHLVGRHPGVKVDYLGASNLEQILFSSEQGRRIEAEFFGDPDADARALAQAFRAGGTLRTGADVVDRLEAVAERLRQRDPFYTYLTITAEADLPRAALHPQTIVAIEIIDEESVVRIEAIPRGGTRPEQLPRQTVHMSREQAEQFERFLSHGGELLLEGVRVDLHNLPREFEDLDPSGTEMTVQVSAPRQLPPPWDARFTVEASGLEVPPIVIHLEPLAQPPPGWEAALSGKTGAMEATITLRRREGRGEAQVTWSFKDDLSVSTPVRAAQLNFVEALHREGRLRINDLSGARPELALGLVDRRLDEEFYVLQTLTNDLAVIEEWTGRELIPTKLVHAREVQAIHTAAEIIRAKGSKMTVGPVRLTMPQDKADDVFKLEGGDQLLIEQGFGLTIFGTDIEIGVLRGVLVDIDVELMDSSKPGMVDVTLTPVNEAAAHPTFELVRAPKAPPARRSSRRRR